MPQPTESSPPILMPLPPIAPATEHAFSPRELTDLAAHVCGVPTAVLTLLTRHGHSIAATTGWGGGDVAALVRACEITLREGTAVVATDTGADPRFSHNGCSGNAGRFFAAVPLLNHDGEALGVLALLDTAPRAFPPESVELLRLFGRHAAAHLRLRRDLDRLAGVLAHQSRHDALTGLPNRMLLVDRIERCLERARRRGRLFALLFLDLDRFKVVNDSLGHAAGDQLLLTLAGRLSACLRPTDTVAPPELRADNGHDPAASPATPPPSSKDASAIARLGGDEFTVLLDEIAAPADALRVADRLLHVIRQPLTFEGNDLYSTASIGVVVADAKYASARDVLRDADAAMYRAKAEGKNRAVLFDATMHQQAVARLGLEHDLRHAIGRGELSLCYQPLVGLAHGALEGFEALLRWRRNGKPVSPAEFIPVAEDTGIILQIGRWVLGEAVRQLADWRRRGLSIADAITMAVNVSRKQLADPDFVEHARRVTTEHGVPPSAIKLEITESVIMADGELALAQLQALKKFGFAIAVDDFGTGYSSLSCLHQFPIDVVKLDRSFITHFAGRRDAAAVIHATVTLAHSLGISVVAEGLETAEDVTLLRDLDCDTGQGYHFAKPLPAPEAEAYLLRETPAAA
jgi:predicted signal transduction protein with EAL and GGDEF domain